MGPHLQNMECAVLGQEGGTPSNLQGLEPVGPEGLQPEGRKPDCVPLSPVLKRVPVLLAHSLFLASFF